MALEGSDMTLAGAGTGCLTRWVSCLPWAILALLLAGCGGERAAPERGALSTRFVPPPSEGLTLVRFNEAALAGVWKLEVLEDSKLAPGDPRPPFSIYTVQVEGGAPGAEGQRVVFRFLNGALMDVSVTLSGSSGPDVPSQYVAGYKAEVDVATQGGRRITWRRTAFTEAANDWIRKYS